MYIDPNTGGMLFQVLAAAFVVISGFILVFSSKIRMFFARLKRNNPDETDQGDHVEDDTNGAS